MIAGIPGRSRAIDVAQMIGLPSSDHRPRPRAPRRSLRRDRHAPRQLQKRMSEVLAQRDEARACERELDRRARALAAETREAGERARPRRQRRSAKSWSVCATTSRARSPNEIKNLREMDRNARANVNAAEIVNTLTKPVDQGDGVLPAEQREVHVGDKAEHRKFKVTGKVVSIDGARRRC
jgi:dsDNA-specific endonuclease/ATPase MutS2